MKCKKYHTVEQFQNLIEKMVERGKIDSPSTRVQMELGL